MPKTVLGKIKSNWKSGITTMLVSIPLSVSLAVASQSTPTAGIITAVWAGLVASIFGGSNYNIVGPTGALSGILAAYALTHGADILPMLAIVVGVATLVAYLFKLERYLVFIPAGTIHGFTLGVAFIIALNQLNFATGLSGLPQHERFIENIIESLKYLHLASPITFIVFLCFLAGLFSFNRLAPKFPGIIILSVFGIFVGYLGQINAISLKLQTLGSKYADIKGALFSAWRFNLDSSLIITGIVVALIAILETMISAKIADGMTKTKHNKRKEMLGLGFANIASGIMGGMPATAALARTALNIKTGANDKMSATISSIFIGMVSIIFLRYFSYIPLAVIASILVYVAIRMVQAEHFIRLYKWDKKEFALSMIVAFFTIYEDPIIGILIGTTIALVLFMEKISRGQFELIINDMNKKISGRMVAEDLAAITKEGDTLVYSIKGQLAYINAQSHLSRFEQDLNGYHNVVLRLRELYFIDLDGVDAFNEIVELIRSQGKGVLITGANPLIDKMLEESMVFKELKNEKLVFERTRDALKHLGYEHI